MDDTSLEARYHWYSKPVGGAKESFGWREIERSLAVEAARSQLHRPPAAKFDLVQGNIFSRRPCLQFRRPGHMLWNEVGRQTKRLVICPQCVAIDLLLLGVSFLERTGSAEKEIGRSGWGAGRGWILHRKKRVPRRDLPWGSAAVVCHHWKLELIQWWWRWMKMYCSITVAAAHLTSHSFDYWSDLVTQPTGLHS